MASERQVVAFCPWIVFRGKPLEIAGVHVMGFKEAEMLVPSPQRAALWRSCKPYYDHFLDHQDDLSNWNENPLIYIIDPRDPLKDLSPNDARIVQLVNSFLYVCTFSLNRSMPGGLQVYTNATDWSLYFQPVQDPEFFALGERRIYGSLRTGGHQWKGSVFTMPVECNQMHLRLTQHNQIPEG